MAETEENRLWELMRMLERKVGYLQEAQFTCCGVSMAQCHALFEIGRAQSLSLNALAELLDLDTSTMSRTVNNLVQARLAKRTADKDDRRYVRIELSAKGKELFEKIVADANEYYTGIFENIPEDKRGQVFESLALLIDAIDEKCCKIC